jgi:hypothetical protein
MIAFQQHLAATASAYHLMAKLGISGSVIPGAHHKHQQQASRRNLPPCPQQRAIEKARRYKISHS